MTFHTMSLQFPISHPRLSLIPTIFLLHSHHFLMISPIFSHGFSLSMNFPRFSPCFPMIPSDSHHFPHIFARTSGRFSGFPRFPNHGPSFQVHPAVAAHDQNVLPQHRGGRREARRGQLGARKPALRTQRGNSPGVPERVARPGQRLHNGKNHHFERGNQLITSL